MTTTLAEAAVEPAVLVVVPAWVVDVVAPEVVVCLAVTEVDDEDPVDDEEPPAAVEPVEAPGPEVPGPPVELVPVEPVPPVCAIEEAGPSPEVVLPVPATVRLVVFPASPLEWFERAKASAVAPPPTTIRTTITVAMSTSRFLRARRARKRWISSSVSRSRGGGV